jgi:hypothetical protein
MRSFATIGIGSLGSISIQHTMRLSASERPPGIVSDAWIRIEEDVGIVITSRQLAATTTLPPCATGYFMVRHGGFWLRLLDDGACGQASNRSVNDNPAP